MIPFSLSLSPFPWQPGEVLIFEELKSTRGLSVASGDENDPDHLAPFSAVKCSCPSDIKTSVKS